jgi:hypothetical protein
MWSERFQVCELSFRNPRESVSRKREAAMCWWMQGLPGTSSLCLGNDQVFRDEQDVELQELNAAYAYAARLQRQIRKYSPEQPFDWIVKVAVSTGETRSLAFRPTPNSVL